MRKYFIKDVKGVKTACVLKIIFRCLICRILSFKALTDGWMEQKKQCDRLTDERQRVTYLSCFP